MFFSIYIRVILSSVLMYSIAAQANAGHELSGILSLYENGTIKDSSESPYCSNNQKISISSYNLKIKKCNNEDNRCQFQKKPLSSWAVMLLHEKCSLKKECDYVNFSSEAKDLKNDTLDSVLIDYQCLGDEYRLYEMCGHQKETITSSVHLITGKESRQYSSCQCLLQGQNNSVKTVILKDIRLYSTKLSPRKCSESVLNINKKSFTCNSTSSAFGSVFNQSLSMKTHNETLTVSLDVEDPEFNMVWILVKTKGSMSMECSGKRREVATKSTEVFGHSQTSEIQSDGSVKPNRIDVENTIVLSVLAFGLVIVTAVIICFRIKCGKALPSYGDRKGDESTGQCKAKEKSDNTEETLGIENQWENRSENIEEIDHETPKSFRRRLVYLFRLFFRFKSIKSRQSPQYQLSVESNIAPVDKDVSSSTHVDIHLHAPFSESFCDTEETPLSDETNMPDCYGKAIACSPVQESGQEERGGEEGNRKAYAILYHSSSNDGALGNDENNDYDYTQYKNQTPYRNSAYDHLPKIHFFDDIQLCT